MGNEGNEIVLKEQILDQIKKRERVRVKEAEELEDREKEDIRRKIVKGFQDELSRCLRKRKNYKRHKIPADQIQRKYVKEVARNLGFTRTLEYSYKERKYFFIFSILEHLNRRQTFAQEKLKKFEKLLEQAKLKRKLEIEKECRLLFNAIEAGQYEYSCSEDGIFIYIESEKELDAIDKELISKFFMGYNLPFEKFEEGKLYFKIKSQN